jgi:hypothetical protein
MRASTARRVPARHFRFARLDRRDRAAVTYPRDRLDDADALASISIAILILRGAWTLVGEAIDVLMEGDAGARRARA